MDSDSKKLLYDRVRLIRAMQQFLNDHSRDLDAREYDAVGTAVDDIRKDTDSFLSYSQDEDSYVSYAQKPQHKYDSEKRYRTKLGRYLRRNLNITDDMVSDDTIEQMSYNVMGSLPNSNGDSIEIITGEDIIEAYDKEYGGASCMTGGNANITEVYALNPDKVSMVIYKEGYARALLWTCDDGTKVLDRIYPNSGVHVDIITKWAVDRGYVHRVGNNCNYCRLSDNNFHTVTLKMNDLFPFMDTFKHGTIRGNTIKITNSNNGNIFLEGINGNFEDMFECENCGNEVSEDDMVSDEGGHNYCEDCYSNVYTRCGNCDGEVDRDDARSPDGNMYCESCYDELYTTCADCDEEIAIDDSYTWDDNLLCDNCYVGRQKEKEDEEEACLSKKEST